MRQTVMVAATLMAAMSLTGCYIDKRENGDGKNVKIATPFGGVRVKTNDADVLAGIGLPAYPGATLVKKDGDHDDGAADVDMSFGSFSLKVKAAAYRTSDRPEQVLAFYRKALGRFGDVIQCDHKRPVGSPTRTTEGLTCEDDEVHGAASIHGKLNGIQIQSDEHEPNFELRAGSRKRQHIATVDPDGSGTKFGLVALDLPTDFHFGQGKDKDDADRKQ